MSNPSRPSSLSQVENLLRQAVDGLSEIRASASQSQVENHPIGSSTRREDSNLIQTRLAFSAPGSTLNPPPERNQAVQTVSGQPNRTLGNPQPQLITGAGGGTGPARTPTSVLTEARGLFRPYQTPNLRGRGHGVARRSTSIRNDQAGQQIFKTFCCLGSPDDKFVPDSTRIGELVSSGLGITTVELDKVDSSNDVQRKLRQAYSKLQHCEFEIMRSQNSRAGSLLIRINYEDDVPKASMLATIRANTLYIRPKVKIFGRLRQSCTPTEDRSREDEVDRPNLDGESTNVQNDIPSLPDQDIEEIFVDDEEPRPFATTNVSTNASVTSTSQVVTDLATNEDVQLFTAFRQSCRDESALSQEVIIVRDTFSEDLFSIYKNPDFSFTKKLYIKFIGEPGRDLNALTNEFFTMAMTELKTMKLNGKYPLFEGEEDYRLPNPNPVLLAEKIFYFLGTFIGHAIIQVGVGFVGLCPRGIQFMFEGPDRLEPIELHIKDLPNYEERLIAQQLKDYNDESDMNGNTEGVRQALKEAGIFENISHANRYSLLIKFLEYKIYHARVSCYEQIRAGLKRTPVFDFLKENPNLLTIAFPLESRMRYSGSEVLRIIRYEGEENLLLKCTLEGFILRQNANQIRKLLQAWTGWPGLPENGLEVKLTADAPFCFHSCFGQLEFSPTLDPDQFLQLLQLAVENCFGFGRV